MGTLEGKVAVVTGASKGIGASNATHLAEEGAAVVVNYASSKDGADRVVAEIVAKGGRAVAVQADLAEAADVDRLFAETARAFGRLDILVNNAGVYEFRPLDEVTEAHVHRHFDLSASTAIRVRRSTGSSSCSWPRASQTRMWTTRTETSVPWPGSGETLARKR